MPGSVSRRADTFVGKLFKKPVAPDPSRAARDREVESLQEKLHKRRARTLKLRRGL